MGSYEQTKETHQLDCIESAVSILRARLETRETWSKSDHDTIRELRGIIEKQQQELYDRKMTCNGFEYFAGIVRSVDINGNSERIQSVSLKIDVAPESIGEFMKVFMDYTGAVRISKDKGTEEEVEPKQNRRCLCYPFDAHRTGEICPKHGRMFVIAEQSEGGA